MATFATAGFILPIALLVFYTLTGKPAGDEMLWLCPASIASMALDRSTTFTALFIWTLICASNAVLYSALGMLVALPLAWKNRN